MIRCTENNAVIGQHVVEAKSILGRMRGMLGRHFNEFDAMVFRRNNSIHMFFMGMALDIIFLDSDDRVISLRHNLRPWRLAADFSAAHVIELPAGSLAKIGLAPGDHLEITVDSIL